MHALFEALKVCYWAKGVDNDYTLLPAHPSIGKYRFMPPSGPRSGSQDCQLAQPCQTLAYTSALQYWVEKAQLPIPGEMYHLAESVEEPWQMMEPLVSFMEEEVFVATAPSNWVEVSLPQLVEPIP